MSIEVESFLTSARAWLAADARPRLTAAPQTSSELLRFSIAIPGLLRSDDPSESVLDCAGLLFDDLACSFFQADPFGERFEIAMTLAFISWRHSFLLGRESESLEWLAVSDCIATEELADLSRLEDFLYLSGNDKSAALCEVFLGSSIDVFLSLAILRRDRLSRPLQVIEAASGIYAWLRRRSPDPQSKEEAFFRTEAAWLVAAELRMLGMVTETRCWLGIAKQERRKMHVSSAARAKLQLISLLLDRERHQYRQLLDRFGALHDRCLSLGLYREALTCRYATAITEKVQGRSDVANSHFDELFAETRNSVHGSIAGLSLGHIGRRLAAEGRPDQAQEAFNRAIELLQDSGDVVNLGSLILEIGDAQLGYGRPYQAARLFQIAAEHYYRAGSRYWRAYAEILAAEALLDAGRPGQAIEALAIAFPLIKRESMETEGVHALQILNKIASRSDVRKGPIADLLAEMRKGMDG